MRYKNHLGTRISKNVFCTSRNNTPYNYENCPYNVLHPNKKVFRVTKEGVEEIK